MAVTTTKEAMITTVAAQTTGQNHDFVWIGVSPECGIVSSASGEGPLSNSVLLSLTELTLPVGVSEYSLVGSAIKQTFIKS